MGMTFELPKRGPEKFLGFVLKLEGAGTPVVAAATAPKEVKPPEEQDRMEQAIRKFLTSLAGRVADGRQGDQLRQKIGDVLRDGSCSFSNFIAVVEGIGKDDRGNSFVKLKSFVNAEVAYHFQIAASELKQGGEGCTQATRCYSTGDLTLPWPSRPLGICR